MEVSQRKKSSAQLEICFIDNALDCLIGLIGATQFNVPDVGFSSFLTPRWRGYLSGARQALLSAN